MKSDQINELATAQSLSDRFAEEKLTHSILYKKFKSTNKPLIDAFFEKLAFGSTGCWYWLGFKNKLGYGVFQQDRAHRAAYKLFFGEIPEGLHILHKCDVRSCVNPEHLFMGTHSDNMRDCASKGRNFIPNINGEKNPQAKLTAELVSSMRLMRNETNLSFKKLAKIFNVSTMTAYRACVGISWRSTNV